jgi:hypothetical protein
MRCASHPNSSLAHEVTMAALSRTPMPATSQLPRHTEPRLAAFLTGLALAGTIEFVEVPALAQTAPASVIIRLAPEALISPDAALTTPVSECEFAVDSLAIRLTNAGIQSMRRVFPEFVAADTAATNAAGEPVTLLDLSDFYVATLSTGMSPESALAALGSMEGIRSATINAPIRALTCQPTPPAGNLTSQWVNRTGFSGGLRT